MRPFFSFLIQSIFLFSLLSTSSFSSIKTKIKRPFGIEWFSGSVENAFKQAKIDNRPMFLFWTAVWCPPCNEFKKKILSNQEVKNIINKSFIPIHLDGDDRDAQLWGSRLKTKGYPSLLVLDSSGKEVSRISNRISASQFVSALQMALQNNHFIKDLIQKKGLSKDEWSILISHNWRKSQDVYVKSLSHKEIKYILKKLIGQIPSELKTMKWKLQVDYYDYLLRGKRTNLILEEVLSFVKESLKDPSLIENDFKTFYILSKKISYIKSRSSKKGKDHNNEGKQILKKVFAVFKEMEKNKKISKSDILRNYKLFVNTLRKDKVLSESFLWNKQNLESQIVSQIKNIRKNLSDNVYEHHASIWIMTGLLKDIEQRDMAYKILKEEIKNSAFPYYLMSSLGKMDIEDKKISSGMNWYKKAYQTSSGSASKLRWGTLYLKNLIKYHPEDNQTILNTSKEIYQDLLKSKDSFYGRNLSNLEQLKSKFKKWTKKNKTRKSSISNLSKKLISSCNNIKTDQKNVCQRYFKNLGI